MDMIKNIYKNIIIVAMFILPSCSDFLDIVPDNTITIDDVFANSEQAYNGLVKVYYYLPEYYSWSNSPFLFGDEWVERPDLVSNTTAIPPFGVMMGAQNNGSPLYNLWGGTAGARGMYEGIRSANTFLEKINLAKNMSDKERNNWIAQVKFLKAYFHYQLIEYYGPIVIIDKNVNVDAIENQLMGRRSKIDESFNYVIGLIDEAIPDLDDRTESLYLGMIDKKIALAIKARILLLRASPLYNGNKEYYSKFLDFDGQPFFPQDEDPQKWKDALTAVNEAITFCEAQGVGLYEYTKSLSLTAEDDIFFTQNPARMRQLYSLRMKVTDVWNKDIIWGRTHIFTQRDLLQHATAIRALSIDVDPQFQNPEWGPQPQHLGVSFAMIERYYTKNGLPIDADVNFKQALKYDVETTPDTIGGANTEWIGILQPKVETAYLYQDRELRFYADLGITGGYWRQYQAAQKSMMLLNTIGGANSEIWGQTGMTYYFWSGIGVQKFVHIQSRANDVSRWMKFPYPIIRMADLYLMKAECENEVNGPASAYDALNVVRLHAGIPKVEEVWSDPARISPNYINKHKDKDYMRKIILQERSIELSFEGARFFDVRRHKLAIAEFNQPTMGWVGNKGTINDFFKLELKQGHRFQTRDYLWPISLSEMNVNPNLKQNPFWPGAE
jgi:hypothetical protein